MSYDIVAEEDEQEAPGNEPTDVATPAFSIVSEEVDPSPINVGSADEPGFFTRAFDAFNEWRDVRPKRKFSREEAREITKQNIKRNREMFGSKGSGPFSFGDMRAPSYSSLVRAGLEEPPEDEVENAMNDYLRGDPDQPALTRPTTGDQLTRGEPDEDEIIQEDPWGLVIWNSLTNTPALFKRQYGGAKMFLNAPRNLAYVLEAAADEGVAPEESFALEVEAYVKGEDPSAYYAKLLKEAAENEGLQEGARIYQEADDYLRDFRSNVNEDSAKYYTGAIIEGALNMAPALVATAATRSPSVGAALMGGQVFADQYADSISRGRSHSQAVTDGMVFAAAETLTERIPLGLLTKEGGTLLARVLKSGGAEALQEPLTQLIQEGYSIGIIDEEMTFGEALVQMTTTKEGLQMLKRSSIIGFGVGGSLASVTHPFYRNVTEEDLEPPTQEKKRPKPKKMPSEEATEISEKEAQQLGLKEVDVTQELLERVATGDPLTIDEQYTLTNFGYGRFVGEEERVMMLPKGRRKLMEFRDEPAPEEVQPPEVQSVDDGILADEDGEAIVVWRGEHGVKDESQEFQTRLPSLSFGSLKTATVYAKHPNNRMVDDIAQDPNVRGYTLKMNKPFINQVDDPFVDLKTVRQKLGQRAVRQLLENEELSSRIMNTDNWQTNFSERFDAPIEVLEKAPELVDNLYLEAYSVLDDAAMVKAMKAKGFDGAVHMGMGANFDEVEYRVFDESQAVPLPQVTIEMEEDDVSESESFSSDRPQSRRMTAERLDAVQRRVEEPVGDQKKAGNYKKGHLRIDSLPVTIETAKGQTRKGKDPDGNEWSVKMKDAYGYIKGTRSRERDGYGGFDQVDAFVGRNAESGLAVVINQKKQANRQISQENFDEHKVMLGYRSVDEALEAYRRNYDDGGKLLGNHVEMTTEQLRSWLNQGDQTKMVAEADRDTPKRRRTDKTNAGKGKSVEEVQRALRPIYRAFRTVPPVRVVEAIEDLPKHLQAALDTPEAKTNTTGLYDQGALKDEIYIVANNVLDTNEAIETMLHEVVGHYGMHQAMEPWDFDQTMDQIAESFPKEVRSVAKVYGLDWNNIDERRIASEEYIAHTAQRVLAGRKVDSKMRKILDAVVKAIKNFLLRLRGRPTHMTDGQVMSLIAQASDYVQKPGGYKRDKRRGRRRYIQQPAYFSKLWAAFNDSDMKSGSPESWKQFVAGQMKKGGFKEAEAKWLGFVAPERTPEDTEDPTTWFDDVTWNDIYHLVVTTVPLHGMNGIEGELQNASQHLPKEMYDTLVEHRNLQREIKQSKAKADDLRKEAWLSEYGSIEKKIREEYSTEARTIKDGWFEQNPAVQFLPAIEQRDLAVKEEAIEKLEYKLDSFGREKPKKIPKDAVLSYIERNGVEITIDNPQGGSDDDGPPYFDENHPDETEEPNEDLWYEYWDDVRAGHWDYYYLDALADVHRDHGWDSDLDEEENEAADWDGTSESDMEEEAYEKATEAIEEEYYSEERSEWENKNTQRTWWSGSYTIRTDDDGDFQVYHENDGDLGYNSDFDSAVAIAEEYHEKHGRGTRWHDYMLRPKGDNYEEMLFRWRNPDQTLFQETGHWDDEDDNYVAHARFDERPGPDGKPAIYVDEQQSDWAQDIRDRIEKKASEIFDEHNYDPNFVNSDGSLGGGPEWDGTPINSMLEEARRLSGADPIRAKKFEAEVESIMQEMDLHRDYVEGTLLAPIDSMNDALFDALRSLVQGPHMNNAQAFLTEAKVLEERLGKNARQRHTELSQALLPGIMEKHGMVAGLNESENKLYAAVRELSRKVEEEDGIRPDQLSEERNRKFVLDAKVLAKNKYGMTEEEYKKISGTIGIDDYVNMWKFGRIAEQENTVDREDDLVITHQQMIDDFRNNVRKAGLAASNDWDTMPADLPEYDGSTYADMEALADAEADESLMDEGDVSPSAKAYRARKAGDTWREAWQQKVDDMVRPSNTYSYDQASAFRAYVTLSEALHKIDRALKSDMSTTYKDKVEPFRFDWEPERRDKLSRLLLDYDEARSKMQRYRDGIIFPPFEKDWQLLVLKGLIHEGMRRGHSRIYISKGEVHGVRWSGAETVDSIIWHKSIVGKTDDQTVDMFTGKKGSQGKPEAAIYSVTLPDTGRTIEVPYRDLSKTFGSRVAKTITSSEVESGHITADDVGLRAILVPKESGGQRLTGSRKIYNEITPNMANKFLKQYKAKMVSSWVPGPGRITGQTEPEGQGLAVKKMPGKEYPNWLGAIVRPLTDSELESTSKYGVSADQTRLDVRDMKWPHTGQTIHQWDGTVWGVELADGTIADGPRALQTNQADAEAYLGEQVERHASETWGYEAWEIEFTPELFKAMETGFPLFARRDGRKRTGDPGLDEALNWAERNIGPQGPRSIEHLQQRVNEVLRIENKQAKIEQALIDQFAGLKWAIRQTHGHDLPAEISAYKQAHFTTSVDSQMMAFLMHGVPTWEQVGEGSITQIKEGSQGLLEVLEPVADKIQFWGYWMAARRAKRLLAEGREQLFTEERIEELLKLGERFPEFQDVADAYAQWKTEFLDWAEGAGVINTDTRPLWDQADYVPFYRLKSDEMGGSFAKRAGMGGPGIANVAQPIKRLLGSKHPLGDILENIIVNFQHIATTAMKNKAAQLAVENLQDTGLLTPAKGTDFMKKEFIPMDELKRQLKKAGVDWQSMSEEALVGMQKMWTLQRPQGDQFISVLYNGQKKWFEVHEETLLRSLTAINERKFSSIMGRLGMWIPRKFKRLGTSLITLAPGFMAANWFRDLFMAFTNSRHAKMPKPWAGVTGAWKAWSQSPEMVSMMAAGGAFYSGYINANDPVASAKAIKRALRETGFKNRILDAPWKFFHLYNDIGAASENANRIGSAYIPAIKAGAGKAEAVWEAKDLMNFAKHGDHAMMQFFAQSVMFLNARIQGLVRYGQRFKEAPGITFAKSMLYAMAVLAVWLKNKDDERYKALPEEEKDMYVHFWVNGKHWRLPKAFEVGMIFGVGTERMFEYFYSNEDDAGKVAIDRMWFVFGEVFNFFNRETIVPLPQFAQPLFEASTNWNAFFQAPIVPEYMLDVAEVKPELSFRPSTSPTMRELARGMPKFAPDTLRNPLLLEHLVRGYTGTLGSYAMMMSDDMVRKQFDYPPRPALRWQNIPFAGRFYRGDEPPSRSNYEEIMYQVRNNARQISRAIDQMERLEMDDEIDKFLEEGSKYDPSFTNEDVVDAARSMEPSYNAIKRLRKEANEIWEDEDMSPEEKLRELNRIYQEKLENAKDAWLERPGASLQFEALQQKLMLIDPMQRPNFLVEQGLDSTADLLSSLPRKPSDRLKQVMEEYS